MATLAEKELVTRYHATVQFRSLIRLNWLDRIVYSASDEMEEKYGRSGFSVMYLLRRSFRYNSTCFIQSFGGVTQRHETWVGFFKYLLLASSPKCRFEDRKITNVKLKRFCKQSDSTRETTRSKLNRRTIFVISIARYSILKIILSQKNKTYWTFFPCNLRSCDR